MKKTTRWGILAPGKIANKFATDLQKIPDAELVAIGSRSQDRAAAFAARFKVPRVHGSYQDLVTDPDVDAIYVASPHTFHREHSLLCLEHGKAVLCEKPLAVNAAQAAEMVKVARHTDTFLMEAMWTRFLPVWVKVREWLAQGKIGDIRQLYADFCFRTGWDPKSRLLDPDLAGGGLLDVGIYTVALARNLYGTPPAAIDASAHIGGTGVDEQTGMLFKYPDGALALLSCAVRTTTPMEARIMGTDGMIYVPPLFWQAKKAELRVAGQEPEVFTADAGYHFEAMEVAQCLREGKKESDTMPLDESLETMGVLDQVRAKIGLRYPFE
jgi:predicted dehydrogenase